uniref:Uncharacterized protein n=1 Tax=Nelumbo nucifera TaxID=4432 RepID=A0A822YD72_NELNU|nr:TPA_asm: hypothetical protein HUJ06_010934 [Nelumbo nucifera]
MVRTKCDQVAPTTAGLNASWVIIGVGISLGTSRLEDPGISSWLAGLRVAVSPGATVFGRLECKASALTSHHPPVVARSDLQPDRAHLIQIANAACVVALSGAPKRGDGDGQVVAVDKADVVEILFPECDLG